MTSDRIWSVEAQRGGYTIWEDVQAESADAARALYAQWHPDAKIVAVSAGASQAAWHKDNVSIDDMLRHLLGAPKQ